MGQILTAVPPSGIAAYDNAVWSGGVPRVNRVYKAFGMSTLLQSGGDCYGGVMEAEVPENDAAVALFRVGGPARIDRRIHGQSARASYRVGEGTLLAAGTDSWWAVDEATSANWFHVHFDRALVASAEATHRLRLETVPSISDASVTALVNMIYELVSYTEEPDPLLWQSLGQALLWRLLLLTGKAREPDLARGGLAPWQARRTTEYIADNLDRRVTLEELATVARLSPFHFARAFARTVGMPPYRYQRKLRMEKACELLATSGMRIIDIALAVGYESPQALARVFQAAHGVTPSEWRRRHGGT
ncbi:helix-turn-helix domain-containing protein [Erythrobacter sp. NE805]|uniref:AraC family transcriptional regulator n=1 Tax=Erythrobacter sp. NE805 TaxID=3389875 RepID=UPI00396B35F0